MFTLYVVTLLAFNPVTGEAKLSYTPLASYREYYMCDQVRAAALNVNPELVLECKEPDKDA